MTSIYNKYIDRDCVYTRVMPDSGRHRESINEKLHFKGADLTSMLSGMLPDWLDGGDLLLFLLLFFLYIESDDSDFLIILAVIAFSIFKEGRSE